MKDNHQYYQTFEIISSVSVTFKLRFSKMEVRALSKSKFSTRNMFGAIWNLVGPIIIKRNIQLINLLPCQD